MGTNKLVDTYWPLGSHGRLENIQFAQIPLLYMIGWTIDGRVQWKSSAKKVTHSSTIPGLSALPWPTYKASVVEYSLNVPIGIQVKALGLTSLCPM